MDIKTKYNPGDKVWVMINNKPIALFIDSIDIRCFLDYDKIPNHSIIYSASNGIYGGKFTGKEIFVSKEDFKRTLV